MPELPEVETIVRDLDKKVLGRTFLGLWSDWGKGLRKPKNFGEFKKQIIGRKILNVSRRAKFILIELSGGKILLIHQKLTGHLLMGKWRLKDNHWITSDRLLAERTNSYIHLMFFLDADLMMGLSDLRKFAYVELWDANELENSKKMRELGPEPLLPGFNFEKFKAVISNKKGSIKKILMDQTVIAGIGNIYSDEILWQAKVHPLADVRKLKPGNLKNIYSAMLQVLKKAIKLRGESISDYRDTAGKKGNFDQARNIYRRKDEKCRRCGTKIIRIKIGGRSSCLCPNCQKQN